MYPYCITEIISLYDDFIYLFIFLVSYEHMNSEDAISTP